MQTDNNERPRPQLLRGIGFIGAAVLVINSVIGSGIFAMPAVVAARAGAWSPWLFLVVGLLMLTVVMTFAELASYFKDSGGPVLYTTTAFGPLTGFVTGWTLIISRMTAFAANAMILVMYVGELWPWFGRGAGRSLLIVAVSSLLTFVNYVGVKSSMRTMAALTFLKLTPILLLIVLGLQHVSGATLFPRGVPEIDDFGSALLLLIYPFVGFESATVLSGETRSPKATIPRALIRTQLAIGVLYFLVVLVYIAVLPDASAGATLIDLGRALMGPAGVALILLAAVFSVAGNLASIMLAVPRLTFSLSTQKLLPAWFGEIHPRFATPGHSILLFGALGLLLTLSGTFIWVAAASSLTRLITYVLCICALPRVRRKAAAEDRAAAYRVRGGYTIPLIGLALSTWIAAQSELRAWLVTAVLLLAGLVLYRLAAPRRAGERTPPVRGDEGASAP